MRIPISLAVAATALTFTGCGGDESSTNTVDLRGDEYAFVMSEKVEGGWTTLRFENTGDEQHEFALLKLGDGKTIADVRTYLADPKAEQQPPPDWVEIRAGIPTLAAGEEASLTQRLEPGRFVLLCFLDGPDGKTHIEHGMAREFEVEGDAGAAVPTADTTITLGGEFAAPRLDAGKRTIELRNGAARPSSVFLVAYEPGKTAKDIERWEKNGLRGPAPARFLGGAIDIPAHTSVYYELELEAGRDYALFDDERGIERRFRPS